MARPDFLKSILHPRALQELPFRDESSGFGLYTSGVGGGNGALDESSRERHSDAIRRQLEECDAAQGTQVISGVGIRAVIWVKGSHQWAPQMGIFFVGPAAGNIWFDF